VLTRNATFVVLGDRKSPKEFAQLYERVYGQSLTLERNGSLEDLDALKNRTREENPDDMRKWMGM